MSSLEVCYRSDKGGRSVNEDTVLAVQVGDAHLLAVADGLGGHAAGEVARANQSCSKMLLPRLNRS